MIVAATFVWFTLTGAWEHGEVASGVRRMFPPWVVGMFGVSAWGGLAQRASSWGCLCATGGRVCQGWYGMVWGGCVLGVLSCILVGGGSTL